MPYARVRPRSNDQELNICEGLYAEGSATTAPYFAYDHELLVTPGESCSIDEDAGEPGGKIWALGFYPAAGNYPPAYRGALFFGDELRECMWAMLPGTGRAAVARPGRGLRPGLREPARHRGDARPATCCGSTRTPRT